jgi:membrane associated rhomboid family serine protease
MFIPIGTEEPKPRRKFPIMTIILILINVAVYIFETQIAFNQGSSALENFITSYGVVPALIIRGKSLSTLLTSIFIHAGLTHIFFNMLFLLVFGDNVEDKLGHFRFLIFYLVAGLMASFFQIAVDPSSMIPSVGASGAIAGVLGGYLIFFPRGYVRAFIILGILMHISRVPAVIFIGFWFIIQFLNGIITLGVNTIETVGVAYWAHIGGFEVGTILSIIYRVSHARTF